MGGLARLLLPGHDPIGCLGTIFIGIAGAVIGGRVWVEVFEGDRTYKWVGAILAAMLLLAIFRAITYRRGPYQF